MPAKKMTENLDMRFLARAGGAWALSAIVLLLIASMIVSRASIGAGTIGYISSAISFLAACFAGASAAQHRADGGIYTGLITAAAISTALLTIGFIVEGAEIEASAVLSVVTFTFSGCLVGSVFLQRNGRKNKKTRFSPKQRQR